jgi:hypothetical protein
MFDGLAADRVDQSFQIEFVMPAKPAMSPTDDAHAHRAFSRPSGRSCRIKLTEFS